MMGSPTIRLAAIALLAASSVATGGCQSLTWRGQEPEPHGYPSARQDAVPYVENMASEQNKTTLPTYVIEPPDILLLQVVKLVPKSPYRFESLDVLQVLATGTLPDAPINGQFPVDPGGAIDLGPAYGKVQVAGLTAEEARQAILDHPKVKELLAPEVSVTLLQYSAQQEISGEHLVAPDGTITLGTYGRVYVAGMTLAEASTAIETQLKKYLETPRVSLDVFAYNSKVYYIISEGAGVAGDNIIRLPITGNETVLDALALINGRQPLQQQAHLDRAACAGRRRLRPDPAGQLGRDHQRGGNRHELSNSAWRSAVHRRGQTGGPRQHDCQDNAADRTPIRLDLVGSPNGPIHQPPPHRPARSIAMGPLTPCRLGYNQLGECAMNKSTTAACLSLVLLIALASSASGSIAVCEHLQSADGQPLPQPDSRGQSIRRLELSDARSPATRSSGYCPTTGG